MRVCFHTLRVVYNLMTEGTGVFSACLLMVLANLMRVSFLQVRVIDY